MSVNKEDLPIGLQGHWRMVKNIFDFLKGGKKSEYDFDDMFNASESKRIVKENGDVVFETTKGFLEESFYDGSCILGTSAFNDRNSKYIHLAQLLAGEGILDITEEEGVIYYELIRKEKDEQAR